MSTPPITHSYNLARLGQAGEVVEIEADEAARTAIARLADIPSVDAFAVTVDLKKTSPSRYRLTYRLRASVTQSCVVTLQPVKGVVSRDFIRELHFGGGVPVRSESALPKEIDLSGQEDDEREEIESLHYDLAAPALEEFLLALNPYPRCEGVEFTPESLGSEPKNNPFAVLKQLKDGP